VLTPEEWVRQQILLFCINELKYALPLISVEKKIKVGTQSKRYDILVYQKDQPWIIIECKNETVKINKSHLLQIESYVMQLSVRYFAITNGITIHCFDIAQKKWQNELPKYE
jgi:hypothetical protein